MTQTAAEISFEGMSPKEVAEKIYSEGGQGGLAFAMMVLAFRAMQATKGKDDALGCDIAKNLFSFIKSYAVEHFIGSFVKECAKDDEFRQPFEESPLLALALMGKATSGEKTKYADVLHNLCNAALDLDKEKTS